MPSRVRAPMIRLLGLLAVAGTLGLVGRAGLRRLGRPQQFPMSGGSSTVLADDGTPLHVEIDDVPGSPLTVVFVHGFTARLEEFMLQRETLRGRYRVVLYDQRGHGKSGWGNVRNATIAQTGRDLATVLDRHAPGPVVLVGHSLGGMTLMAFARQHPELFGPRIKGVFLLATAAGELTTGGLLGLMARIGKRLGLLPVWLWWLRVTAPVVERLRRPGTRLGYLFIRRYLFGRDDADPQNVRLVQNLLEQAPWTITAAFYPTFFSHDEVASLPVFRAVPVLILVGDSDRLTPAKHSRQMADAIGPSAELVVVPGAGHSVNISRQSVVDDAMLRLIRRAGG